MAVDTPARIVILGAGPIGVEAALYARFLGYEVTLLDRGVVGANLLAWGHVSLFTPFAMNRTPLGVSALLAQDPDFPIPADDAILTGRDYVRKYLRPLAESDLVFDSLMRGFEVLGVGRKGRFKGDDIGSPDRADNPFVTLIRDQDGHESTIESEVVIDCTGVFGNSRYLGEGGIPAIGELSCRDHVEIGIPDLDGSQRNQYAARHTLVIGSGYTAATNILNLSRLARESLDTHVTWITREAMPEQGDGPVRQIEGDRLPRRAALAAEANRIASSDDGHVTHWPETAVHAIHQDTHSDHFQVTLTGKHAGIHTFDRVIANVGYRPDWAPQRELQLATCYATEGPLKLAAHLLGEQTADCLDVLAGEGDLLLNPEPNFYVLGTKSYGRNPNFLLQSGYEQIRMLFAILGDRENLNLYATPLSTSSE
ncbi:MAG: FAD-dependent oxidoreductase [Pirellulaceae bacterium]